MALAHFQRTFTDASGNVKPGLSVTVRRESDNGLAALFADAGSVTPKSNPFNTDANGYGSFYVTDGRYRIQATDIDWRNEDLISQPSPNFTAMPQVGGDPIVESGSNADGEWTRWADGTQICTHVLTGVVNGLGTGTLLDMYRSSFLNWTFPVAFIATPVMSSSVVTPSPANGSEAFVVSNAGRVITATSAPAIQMFRGTNIGDVEVCNVQATGRWQ
jgi:hypothetical protein